MSSLSQLTRLRAPRAVLAVGAVATVGAVGGGLAWSRPSADEHLAGARHVQAVAVRRTESLSRSADRLTAVLPSAGDPLRLRDKQFATTPLNIRVRPTDGARVLDTVASRSPLVVTGLRRDGFAEVLYDGHRRWVTATYLAETKPAPPAPATTPTSSGTAPATTGLSTAPCPSGSAVESGLTSGAIAVHRALCAAFPQITTYLGYRPDGEHADGKAIDAMTSDPSLGYQITAFLQSHAAELDLYDIIYRQHIWTPVRASEGWRLMPDRGSITANHYDHVHVAVN